MNHNLDRNTILGLQLHVILDDIERLNKLETKPIEAKFMKFDEEFGEMTAEALKYLGHTYKPYDKEHLKEELADALQCLLSIYIELGEKTGIDIVNDILPEILHKNKKWEAKIKEYQNNINVYDQDIEITQLPIDIKHSIENLIHACPNTVSWGGENCTIKFVSQGSTKNDVVIFQKGLKGPADFFIWTEKGFKHGGYTGNKDKYNLGQFKRKVVDIHINNTK
ncbi:MAG: MazG-like family protein [Candidatus Pacearchaeota archaeon]|jgi:NTP pyrophosphatase (non-canonical NTP hydrolase)|nr:MazG-like family protein [Clostridia bacterium]